VKVVELPLLWGAKVNCQLPERAPLACEPPDEVPPPHAESTVAIVITITVVATSKSR
jgi:hypothetical protein